MSIEEMRGIKISGAIKAFIIPTLIVTGIAISLAGGYTLSLNNKVDQWKDKIYPGVTINGIDVSGKNREETIDLLSLELQKMNDKNIVIKANSKEFKLNLKTVDVKYNIEETVDIALNEGKDEGLFERSSWIDGNNIKEMQAHCTYDSNKMEKFTNDLKKKVNTEPEDATIKKVNDKLQVAEGKNGYTINDDDLNDVIKDAVNDDSFEDIEVTLKMEEKEPKVTKETLSKIDGVLGSFSTNISNLGDVGRTTNVKLATNSCNGKVVMPGEIFSYNNALGIRTPERGYKDAYIYTTTEVKKDTGGGICQVSSTLYRAAMRANLRSTERTNHMYTVDYAELGKDATVVWGSLDYKFKNNYKTPIYIEGYVSGSQVVFNIYGNTSEKGNKTYEIVTDQAQQVGEVTKINSYFVTYENGKQVSKEFIATDRYKQAPKH